MDAILQERPVVGMTVEQLTLALAEPRKKMGGTSTGVPRKVWRFGKDLMVVLSEGKVVWHGPASKMPKELRLPK